MKFQGQTYSCGPAALSAALQARGIVRSEDELALIAKTTNDGTHWAGMIKALRTVQKTEPGVSCRAFADRADVAMLRLRRAVDDGHAAVVVVCTDEPWDHYAAVVGSLGADRLCVFDPGSSDAFKTLTLGEFMPWWRGPKGVRKPYAGIIV